MWRVLDSSELHFAGVLSLAPTCSKQTLLPSRQATGRNRHNCCESVSPAVPQGGSAAPSHCDHNAGPFQKAGMTCQVLTQTDFKSFSASTWSNDRAGRFPLSPPESHFPAGTVACRLTPWTEWLGSLALWFPVGFGQWVWLAGDQGVEERGPRVFAPPVPSLWAVVWPPLLSSTG